MISVFCALKPGQDADDGAEQHAGQDHPPQRQRADEQLEQNAVLHRFLPALAGSSVAAGQD